MVITSYVNRPLLLVTSLRYIVYSNIYPARWAMSTQRSLVCSGGPVGLEAFVANIHLAGVLDPCPASGSLDLIFLAGRGDGDGISYTSSKAEEKSESGFANL